LSDRGSTQFDPASLQQEFRGEGLRIWNFLSENIILREGGHNRHSTIIRRESSKNIDDYTRREKARAKEAREVFKK